ncbi:MAG: hypothetical protein FJ398_10485 [Verrucomicrobia bacterium]|nr:hypothetical protein [Verrucomicrobiota bacterium]
MEPATGLTILGSAIGGAKVVERILGPTADYVGIGLRNWTQRRVENVSRIFEIVTKRLGNQIDQPGSVHPKVLKEVLEEGSFTEDPLACENFGGVLASSRSTVSRDDRGASFLKLIAELTTYQIRTHYVLYSGMKKVFDGRMVSMGVEEHRQGCNMFITLEAYRSVMDFGASEDWATILGHSMFGLYEHGLIGTFLFGALDDMRRQFPDLRAGGIQYFPSARGVELFMWANGFGSLQPHRFLARDLEIPVQQDIRIEVGFMPFGEANSESSEPPLSVSVLT